MNWWKSMGTEERIAAATVAGVFLVIAVPVGLLLYHFQPLKPSGEVPVVVTDAPSTTGDASPSKPVPTVVSDSRIQFTVPADFGLAVSQEQILKTSYIPPCDADFLYCLYYAGSVYNETNFESAGLGVRERAELAHDESLCLSTSPAGYTNVNAEIRRGRGYVVSVFKELGSGAAGHYATGEEYRLFLSGHCYQFDVRVGESQYANYPAGSIREFSKGERDALMERLRGMLSAVELVALKTTIVLPR